MTRIDIENALSEYQFCINSEDNESIKYHIKISIDKTLFVTFNKKDELLSDECVFSYFKGDERIASDYVNFLNLLDAIKNINKNGHSRKKSCI